MPNEDFIKLDPTDPEICGAMEYLAKSFAVMSVRNTFLEELHAGVVPTSHTGDGSDVKVIDAEGCEIPWSEVSRFNDAEMKTLMKQVVDRLFTCLLHMYNPAFAPKMEHANLFARDWDPANEVESLRPAESS